MKNESSSGGLIFAGGEALSELLLGEWTVVSGLGAALGGRTAALGRGRGRGFGMIVWFEQTTVRLIAPISDTQHHFGIALRCGSY
jgi:hypothetical protein